MPKRKKYFGPKLQANGQITVRLYKYSGTVLYGWTSYFQTDRTSTVLYGVFRYGNYGQECRSTAYLDKPV